MTRVDFWDTVSPPNYMTKKRKQRAVRKPITSAQLDAKAVPEIQRFREELESRRKAEESFRAELPELTPAELEFRQRLKEVSNSPTFVEYRKHNETVRQIYAAGAGKDVTTMSPNERREYCAIMDRVRWGRATLESNRPVEQKLAEFKVQLDRSHPYDQGCSRF